MSNNTKTHVSEYVADKYPQFVSFIETYYKYAKVRTNSLGVIGYRNQDTDIDLTLDTYVDEFFSTYGKELPKTTALDRRNLLKLLNDVYESKGTPASFALVFKILYGIQTEYNALGEQILRASDGRWVQEVFFTVKNDYIENNYEISSVITPDTDIIITNAVGSVYTFRCSRTEIYTGNIKIFYPVGAILDVTEGSEILVKDSLGSIIYRGYVTLSPSKVTVIAGGGNFQIGQIFSIEGTEKNTLIKITDVDSYGSIKTVEIIDHGYEHDQYEDILISSYKQRPPDVFGIASLSTPNTYTLGLQDHFIGVTERLTTNIGSVTKSYNASSIAYPISYGLPPSITINDYLQDRATIKLVKEVTAKLPGRYTNNSGQLSDPYIRMQDNFYYQPFSYVIESEIDITKYKDSVLKLLHPAGLKQFSRLLKRTDIDITSDIIAQIVRDAHIRVTYELNLSDTPTYSESIAKTVSIGGTDILNPQATYAQHYGISYYFDNDYYESLDEYNKLTGNLDYFAEDYNTDNSVVDSANVSLV